MVERASSDDRLTADYAIAELLEDGHVLTLFDLREIYEDFHMSPRPASVEFIRRVKFPRFSIETKVRAVVRRYLNMDVIFCPDVFLDAESVAATRYQIEDHRAKRSARRKEDREWLKI